MQELFNSIEGRPDCERQRLYSCAANGGLYCESDIGIFAMVLKGADITEVFSPERAIKLCSKYGLVSGDSLDLRDAYDLSNEKTQAMVVKHAMSTEPTLVIGSLPCTTFSRIQQLNFRIHGDAWGQGVEEEAKAVLNIEFRMKLFKLRRSRGAFFIAGTSSVRGLVEIEFLGEHHDVGGSYDIGCR